MDGYGPKQVLKKNTKNFVMLNSSRPLPHLDGRSQGSVHDNLDDVSERTGRSYRPGLPLNTLQSDVTVKGKQRPDERERLLTMIHSLLEQIHTNRVEVEKDINLFFERLALQIDDRKENLLEEVRAIAVRKTRLLMDARGRCQRSKRSVSRRGSCSDCSDVARDYRPRRSSVDDYDDILQNNGILEPWRNDPATHSSGSLSESKNSSLDSGVAEISDLFSELLEEGNLVFAYDDALASRISDLGTIEETLSSPQLTAVQGLEAELGLSGEVCTFEIVTRNCLDERVFSNRDRISVTVRHESEKQLDVEMRSSQPNTPKHSFIHSLPVSKQNMTSHTKWAQDASGLVEQPSHADRSAPGAANARWLVFFRPTMTGLYTIDITVNGVQIIDSPFQSTVFEKKELTFGVFDQLQTTRKESDDGDWIQHKDNKSGLLDSIVTDPRLILYVADEVHGVCAWKLRVVSACCNVMFSVGVATRSGVPDLDETFAVEFDLNDGATVVAKPLSKKPHRKLSATSRATLHFTVFLNATENVLAVREEVVGITKRINLSPKNYRFHPICGMVHVHHCKRDGCPKPVVYLL